MKKTPRHAVLERLPGVLYKYAGVDGIRLDWIRDLIISSKIYFPSSREFNDPLDCRIPFDFSANSLKIETYWNQWCRENNIPRDERKKRIKSLVLKCQTDAGRKELTEGHFINMDAHGILSLTSEANNMQMWSYYAESHKGVVLAFSMKFENFLDLENILPVEVKYSHDFPVISFYDSNLSKLAETGTKAKSWEHEKEWRLVRIGKTGIQGLRPSMLIGIVFGLRTDRSIEDQIRVWSKLRKYPLTFGRIQHKPNCFDLEVISA